MKRVLNICYVRYRYVCIIFRLKAKAIRDDLNKWDIEENLKDHGDEVFQRFASFVYTGIDGTDHNKLLLFYVFLLNCTYPAKSLEVNY